jgi:hypothetical protein
MAGFADASGVTAPCTTVSISNDPMFVVNGLHRHFWLPTGKATPLMEWAGPGGSHTFVLAGETFGHGPSQWFRSYVIKADGREVLRVSIADALKERRTTKKAHSKKAATLRTLDLWVDAKPVTVTGESAESRRVQGVSVLPSMQNARLIGAAHAENVDIHAPGLALSISSARANKYGQTEHQVRWAHLNMRMKSSLPTGAGGLVAELSGMKPLSKHTKMFLNVPKAVQEHRQEKRQERSSSAVHERRKERREERREEERGQHRKGSKERKGSTHRKGPKHDALLAE